MMIDLLELLHTARYQMTLATSDETIDDNTALQHSREAIEWITRAIDHVDDILLRRPCRFWNHRWERWVITKEVHVTDGITQIRHCVVCHKMQLRIARS